MFFGFNRDVILIEENIIVLEILEILLFGLDRVLRGMLYLLLIYLFCVIIKLCGKNGLVFFFWL